MEKLRQKYEEDQKTLEELGAQLSMSKLTIAELKEKSNSTLTLDKADNPGGWMPDKEVTNCKGCQKEFSITKRKHHCRNCGGIFCHDCSGQVAPIPNEQGSSGKPVRVCDSCWKSILGTK